MSLVRKMILVISLIVFVGAAGVLLDYFLDGMKEQGDLDDVSKMKTEREDLVTDKGTVVGKYVDMYLANKDIIGWIKIKDTKIDYPVMQTQDNPEYYIHRNFKKEVTDAGTPFMDGVSDIFIPTSNFMIYGHNMKNGTMFHDLLQYKDKSFFKQHKTFKFDTIYKGGQGKYAVVAAGYSQIYSADSTKFKYYQHAGMTSESDFNEFIRGVKSLSEYDTGVTTEYGDQLVTLSTCAYHVKNGRFFVVAKRIDAKQVKPQ
ncbi:MAG: class B sortase [Clostridiales bacterium]|nr:class B sortase [Clostridiales bacterium]